MYALREPGGHPFYIGKGHGRRARLHRRIATDNTCRKYNYPVYKHIRNLWAQGKDYEVLYLFTRLSEDEALELEKKTIALYGRKALLNQTDGGDGARARF